MKHGKLNNILLFSFILFAGCNSSTDKEPADTSNPKTEFIHSIETPKKPWTHTEFEKEKFTFALFSDLTGSERNGVFDVAVQQLNLLRPDLIINVGDLVEGDSDSKEELQKQWEAFDNRAQKAHAPVFYVGGNHDLTSMALRDVWKERYGVRYYHFVYKNVLFLVLDSEDNNPERTAEIIKMRDAAIARAQKEGWGIFEETDYAQIPEQVGGNIGKTQSEYFVKAIQENKEVIHTFLFVHKAPWKIEDPEFVTIENALKERPYTVFNGHAHTYEYEERKGHDYIRLATTGGVQFPEKGLSMDHISLVSVSSTKVSIAHLKLDGILNKKGHIPLGGDSICFEKSKCQITP